MLMTIRLLLLASLVPFFCVQCEWNPRENATDKLGNNDNTQTRKEKLDFDHIASQLACSWDPNGVGSTEKVSYVNAQLWKALIDTDEKRNAVVFWEQSLFLQDWGINEGNRTDIFVEARYLSYISQRFNEQGIDVIVHQPNFQTWIDEENPPLNETITGQHKLTWKRYHRLSDINSYLNYLSTHYAHICYVQSIGRSIEGRDLRVVKISNGNPKNKAIWIDGTIHAREWISPAVVTYIINHIVTNWEKVSDLRKVDWYILPVLNPDGYEFSHTRDRLWRKNRRPNGSCYGTDLNRNFGYLWGKPGSSRCPCHDIYHGVGEFSEPESRAVRNFIQRGHRHWKAFLTFHSFGQVIFYPGADVTPLVDDVVAAMQGVNGTYYYGYVSDDDPTPGGSDEWAKRIRHIKYALTFELRDLGNRGFVLPYWNIVPNGQEAVAAVMKILRAP